MPRTINQEERKKPSNKTNDILKKWNQRIPNTTYKQLMEKTKLSRYLIREYCMFNNLQPKSQVSPDKKTQAKLDKLKKIDTKSKTQKQLQKILGLKKRQSISVFLKKHKIKYKISDKDSVTQKRLEKLKKIGSKRISEMDAYEIADVLGFKHDHARTYALRFLRTHYYKK